MGEVVPAVQTRHCRGDLAAVRHRPRSRLRRTRTSSSVALLSCFAPGRAITVLTSDGEFHSASRQLGRLEDEGLATITRVPCRPLATFNARFLEAVEPFPRRPRARQPGVLRFRCDVLRLPPTIAAAVPDKETFILVDGYHGYMALPTDLAAVEHRIFYVAGGYKYAMAGEGACFMHCPPGYGTRPRNTGWFASFGTLSAAGAGSDAVWQRRQPLPRRDVRPLGPLSHARRARLDGPHRPLGRDDPRARADTAETTRRRPRCTSTNPGSGAPISSYRSTVKPSAAISSPTRTPLRQLNEKRLNGGRHRGRPARRSAAVRARLLSHANRRRSKHRRYCPGTARLRSRYRGRSVLPIRNRSIDAAAWRPSRIAHTTSDLPAPDVAGREQLLVALDAIVALVGFEALEAAARHDLEAESP